MVNLRPVDSPDDLFDLEGLFEQCRIADGHAPIGEHKYLDLVAGTAEGSIARVCEVEDEIVAYVHLIPRRDGNGWVLEAAIHPGHRRAALIRLVLDDAIQAATDYGGGPIRAWVYHSSVAEVVRELGFRRERQLLQMRIDLPPGPAPATPAGLRLAPFRVGTDEEHWIDVNNRAFAGHPENGAWTKENLAARVRRDWFDRDGLLMAWRGGQLAGFCWTKLHPGDLGEIYVIAVDPAYHGRSWGTWLALEGLWYLHRHRGASTAMVYVDAANGNAVAMYERIGFELDHVDRSYVR